ncbi:MAG: 5-formyltetrahydrofolate cyclo-ligase [Alphaproteobacteria bacterium]|nr:5-formyltetrahydrofolate cyclo-ligase [Alphaproteobacteria bacterium]
MSNVRHISAGTDKAALRQKCKARRAAIPPMTRLEHAAKVALLMANTLDFTDKTVAGYSPIGEELDIAPLLDALHEDGVPCCLPVTSPPNKQLTFRRWQGEREMTRSHYGIAVPPMTSATVVPDIVIVPMVGFTESLHRIGYGAGYYDATLRALRRKKNPPLAVGVAFSAQQVTAKDGRFVPDAHDEPLDLIITENGILRKPD